MADLGIAIVGTGTVAERHAEAIAALHGARLTAVYDAVPERGRVFGQTAGSRTPSFIFKTVPWQ